MNESGKEEIVAAAKAEEIIGRQSRHRFIASMVSGRYLELCPTYSPDCIFCKTERAGIRCIGLFEDSQI
ncbi:MAG: hypothetical protein HGB15_07275 [Chlorobaculum sp.]|nr:hypothetical protein [Chlorobaculum sp.]